MHVELQDGAGQLGNNGDERIQHRQRVHVGANALGVHSHDERTAPGPRPPDPGTVQHVGMRQDHRFPTPPFRNGSGRAGGQGDQGVGGSDENILLLVVSGALGVMRVAQIVHRVDERLVVPLELAHHFPQILRCDGIEPEMHVEHVEAVAVVASPSPARASKVATNHPEPSAHRAGTGSDNRRTASTPAGSAR